MRLSADNDDGTKSSLEGPSEKAKRLRSVLTDGDGAEGGEVAAMSADQELQLRQEAEKLVDEAVRLFETRFANLPAVVKLRDLWKKHKIGEEDPIWMMVEALSLNDARSQLQLSQVVRILKAFDDLTRFSTRRIEETVTQAIELKGALEVFSKKAGPLVDGAQRLERSIQEVNVLMPQLLDAAAKAVTVVDTRSRRASWELAAIATCSALAGGAVVYFFCK